MSFISRAIESMMNARQEEARNFVEMYSFYAGKLDDLNDADK